MPRPYYDEDWDIERIREGWADGAGFNPAPQPPAPPAVDPLEALDAAGLRHLHRVHGMRASDAYTGQPQNYGNVGPENE